MFDLFTPGFSSSLDKAGHSAAAFVKGTLLAVTVISGLIALTGCGSTGYAGTGIESLSATSATIDSGQSFPIRAAAPASESLSWAMTGACPAQSCGTFSGTTADATTYVAPSNVVTPFKVTLTASVLGTKDSESALLTVNPDPVISGTAPSGTVGVPYTFSLNTSGGTAPLTWGAIGGTLPPGLSFNAATSTISGTPTAPGNYTASVTLVDSSYIPFTVSASQSIAISAAGAGPVITVFGNPPSGVAGTAYSTTLLATGGTAPYSWSVISGSLPSGLSLAASTGVLAGTPNTAGTYSFAVQATDSTGATGAASYSVVITASIPPLTLNTTTLPGGTVGVPYTATIGVSGGTAPYACAITVGNLPAGLSLTGCVVSGTPVVAGTSNLAVKATDSSNPTLMTTGPESITIAPAPLAMTTTALPGGTVGIPYSATIGVMGGTAPYSCSVTAGNLPAGLSLTGCVVSGTPTTAGTSNITAKVTDSSNPTLTTSGPESITIAPAPLSLTTSTLPGGTVGLPYSATIGVTGGTSPYACSVTVGSLPAGLTLTGCLVSGTPTVAETSNLTVKATDSSNPILTTTGPESITIAPAPATLTLTSPPDATVSTPYSGTIGVSGGTAPYTCQITVGSLPPGLSISNCTITGTPTTTGSYPITVKATDSSNPATTTTGPISVNVDAAPVTLTLASPPAATLQTPYSGSIGVTGGTSPYACTIISGNLPPGLTNTSCAITGTPTSTGNYPIVVKATDSSNPNSTVTGTVTVAVTPLSPLTLAGSIPNAVLGVAYTQTLHAAGGLAPYAYSITAGALPAGLSLSTAGVISGTPTAVGASSFTVTAKDSETTPQTASLPLVLQVTYPTTPNDSELNGPYAYLFQGYDDVTLGLFAYQTATAGSFTANGAGLLSQGELDANHQTSNPTGNTVATSGFVGSYTIGSDNRGLLTITTFNPDGTTGATATYAIAVKAPVAPATASAQADLIEYDNNSVQGTKGSGTILAQTTSAFAAGLNGSYAFGMQGDTPCLPSCTIGIFAGPAAAVGQFTSSGNGIISDGSSDLNIAKTNVANATLSGTYGATDGNGRIQLTMQTSGTPSGTYPTDYAVYMVDSSHAFILSSDKHSSYILLAGTAQLQTPGGFANTSLNGAFIGYENSPTNPGLVGATLQSTLNLSTSTIFRGTADGSGACNITNVDVAGLTGLVNSLTGLGSGANVLNALLGTYQSTGSTTCPVSSIGRGVLSYPVPNTLLTLLLDTLGLPTNAPAPRVVYLASKDQGYFLETGYAGLGYLALQSGSPFSEANTFTGTYIYGQAPASSVASINSSGVIKSNGNGTATSTLDTNVGVGTINLLQADQTTTANYTAPNATTGRFTYNGTIVIYAITPNTFVLEDTNALTTSPSVSLLN